MRYSKSKKIEIRKKPIMGHEDEKKQNEIDDHNNDEDEFTKNHQKIRDRVQKCHRKSEGSKFSTLHFKCKPF